MPEIAKLSIVNYGFNIKSKLDAECQKEDDNMIAAARSIVKKHNFGKGAVMITEAYHTDLINSNNYIYTSDSMDKHIKSFYDPFNTPFQCFHNDYGKAIGTNLGAKFIRKPIQLNRGVASGYGKLATFIPENSTFEDEPALDLIQSRRFMAVSIGSKSSRTNMICTICGKSIFECDHMPGKVYDEAKCGIKITSPLFTECSMAGGNPADIDAMVRRMDCFDTAGVQTMESIVDMINDPWGVSIYDNAITDQFQGVDVPNKITDTEGAEAMPNKSIVEIISSYETRIANMEKDNEAIAIALVNANNTIVKLQSQLTTKEADQNTEDTNTTDLETSTDTTETETIETETETTTDQTEIAPVTTEIISEDIIVTDVVVTDEGTEGQTETQENSSENGTDTTNVEDEKPAENILRSMRNARFKSKTNSLHVISRTYRV